MKRILACKDLEVLAFHLRSGIVISGVGLPACLTEAIPHGSINFLNLVRNGFALA